MKQIGSLEVQRKRSSADERSLENKVESSYVPGMQRCQFLKYFNEIERGSGLRGL